MDTWRNWGKRVGVTCEEKSLISRDDTITTSDEITWQQKSRDFEVSAWSVWSVSHVLFWTSFSKVSLICWVSVSTTSGFWSHVTCFSWHVQITWLSTQTQIRAHDSSRYFHTWWGTWSQTDSSIRSHVIPVKWLTQTHRKSSIKSIQNPPFWQTTWFFSQSLTSVSHWFPSNP